MIPKLKFTCFIHVWLSYQLVKIGQVIQVVTQLDPPIVSGHQAIHLEFCNLSTGEEHDVGSSKSGTFDPQINREMTFKWLNYTTENSHFEGLLQMIFLFKLVICRSIGRFFSGGVYVIPLFSPAFSLPFQPVRLA